MPDKYTAPNPGDTRVRANLMTIRHGLTGTEMHVDEQEVIRDSEGGERVLGHTRTLVIRFDPTAPATFSLRHLLTDALLGGEGDDMQLATLLYSRVRHAQLEDDERLDQSAGSVE